MPVSLRGRHSLASSPLYDPQLLAIRVAGVSIVDTMDSIEELQIDIRQRLQTKRGYPGMEHTVDWMTLDLGATWFPQRQRDNFGEPWAISPHRPEHRRSDKRWFRMVIDPIDNAGVQYRGFLHLQSIA